MEFLSETEGIICNSIQRLYPTSWDENHITYTIADGLAQAFQNTSIEGFQRPFKTIWDVRKLRGKPERLFGDLAVYVRIRAWDGDVIQGVGLCEAKRRSVSNSTFEAMKKRQLQNIASHSEVAQLLLYDYSQIAGFQDNVAPLLPFVRGYWEPMHYYSTHLTSYSHAVVVPARLALSSNKRDVSLYKYSIPFSFQLCARYLRGYDLDLSNVALKAVRGFLDKYGGVRTLLLVGVSTSEEAPSLPEDINNNIYGAAE